MRSVVRIFWRACLALGRVFVAWIPTLLLTGFGIAYLYQCLQLLLAPGTGLDFAYESRTGPVRVTADSYAVDPIARRIDATGVVVRDPGGGVVARAARARFWQSGDAVVVDIRLAQAEVTRTDRGFSALDLLPAEDPGAKPQALSLTIDELRLSYTDQTTPLTITQNALLERVIFDTDGRRSLLHATASIPRAGRLSVTLDLDGLRYRLNAKSPAFDVKTVLPVLLPLLPADRRSDAEGLRAQSLEVEGEVLLTGSLPNGGGPASTANDARIQADLSVNLEQVSFPKVLDGDDVRGQLSVVQSGENAGAYASLSTNGAGRDATFDGLLEWSQGLRLRGDFTARVSSQATIWPILAGKLPSGVSFMRAELDGSVSVDEDQFLIRGPLQALSLTAQGQTLTSLVADIEATQSRALALVRAAGFRGDRYSGFLATSYRDQALNGFIRPVARGFNRVEIPLDGQNRLLLAVQGLAIVGGTVARPVVTLQATGFGQYEPQGARPVFLGEFQARAIATPETLALERAVLAGPDGLLTFTGGARLPEALLDLSFQAGGIDLSAWIPEAVGLAYASGRVTGPLTDPTIVGRVTAYQAGGRGLRLSRVAANLTARPASPEGLVAFQQINGRLGLGQIDGDLTLSLREGQIQGLLAASDIDLADLVPESETLVAGQASASVIEIAGTLADPGVRIEASLENGLLAGLPIESIELSASANLREFELSRLSGLLGKGRLEANGRLSTTDQTGELSLRIQGFPLAEIPNSGARLSLEGTMDAQANLRAQTTNDWSGRANIQLRDVGANDFLLGSGTVEATIEGPVIRATGAIGSLNGFLQLESASYHLEDEIISGKLVASNFELAAPVIAFRDQVSLPDLNLQQAFREMSGSLSFEMIVSGTKDEPSVELVSASLANLKTRGLELGSVFASGTATKDDWSLRKATWSRGEGQIVLRAAQNPDGHVSATGDIVRFDPSVLAALFQDVPEFRASLTGAFAAGGQPDNLEGRASIALENPAFRAADGALVEVPVTAITDEVVLSNGVILASGRIRYEGIEAAFEANLPMDAFSQQPKQEAWARFTLPERNIQAFDRYLPDSRLAQSSGRVGGQLTLTGTAKSIAASGEVAWRPDQSGVSRLLLPGLDTALDGFSAYIQGGGDEIRVQASGFSELGGFAELEARIDIAAILRGGITEQIAQDLGVQAELLFQDFRARERIRLQKPTPPNQPVQYVEAAEPTFATLNGRVNLTGTAAKPRISGQVEATGVRVSLPPEFPEAVPTEPSPLQPEFTNLVVTVEPGTKLDLPIGSLTFGGSSRFDGPLSAVTIRAPFTVQSGSLLLPSGRVRLEGGTVLFTSGLADGDARAEIDLQGTTVITLRQSDQRFQTYRLSLDIRGDLLNPQGVQVTGSSDPPDLTQEQIQAIVGQRDFIEGLLSSALGRSDRDGLRDSLFTLAIPNLTAGLTAGLADSLELDYLVLDYNPFDGAIARGGKTVARGLTLEASRQIVQQARQPVKFEVNLAYRPPLRDPVLSRLRFSFGYNERVPWRIGISYSTKF